MTYYKPIYLDTDTPKFLYHVFNRLACQSQQHLNLYNLIVVYVKIDIPLSTQKYL